MIFFTNSQTDVGIRKKTNQDSYSVVCANAFGENFLLAVICDGMGGLEKGEVASAHVVSKFKVWFKKDFPVILSKGNYEDIKYQWNEIVQTENERIADYGEKNGVSLGTTLTVSLFAKDKIYIMHVGDSRFYTITDNSLSIETEDQTLVAREVRRGNMTPQQAEADPRRNVLLQCIGASRIVEPQYIELELKADTTYMLCSDGFRHKVKEDEIAECFAPSKLIDKDAMALKSEKLIELNKERKETDNITVVLIKTFD